MPKKEYDWEIGEAPPKINSHSMTKHKVYEEYLMHYLEVLNNNPQIPQFKLTLVDGFSGGGVYTHSEDKTLYDGSPIRLIKTVEAAEAGINARRESENIRNKLKIYAKYYFLEKKKSNYEYLVDHLQQRGFVNKDRRDIQYNKGSFIDLLPNLLDEVSSDSPNRRTIFILDQYGYSDVPFEDIKKIFQRLSNAEIILTFATDWLIDYIADTPKYRDLLNKIGLSSEINVDDLLAAKKDSNDWRRVIQLLLHDAIPKLSGAKHYTPFFILSKEANKSFWLIHLSNHPRARDVMTALHWKINNQFSHYCGPGLMMFGYDPSKDESLTRVVDMFAASEYSFDAEAEKITDEAIKDELPRIIHPHVDGIEYQELYSRVANSTPATSSHIKKAIADLLEEKSIEVTGQNGEVRRSAVEEKDIISPSRQFRLI
jgi:three-Cys-motif partner protein